MRDGSVIPWLLAAQKMVHSNCTTGIEAAMLGNTPVCYDPRTSLDDWLPERAVSRVCTDLSELESLTCGEDEEDSYPLQASTILAGEFGGIVGTSSGSQNIVSQFETLVDQVRDRTSHVHAPYACSNGRSGGIAEQALGIFFSLRGGRYSINPRNIARLSNKLKRPNMRRVNVRSIGPAIVEVAAAEPKLL